MQPPLKKRNPLFCIKLLYLCQNKSSPYWAALILLLWTGLETNSKFFVQLAAGKIWEKAPVDCSIVEKKVLSPRPQNAQEGGLFDFLAIIVYNHKKR